MEYIGTLVVFTAAIVAIKGGTWNKQAVGLQKITVTGYITAILALLGLIASIIVTHRNLSDVKDTSRKLSQSIKHAEDLKQQLSASMEIENEIRTKTIKLHSLLETAQNKIKNYESLLDVIRQESTRQPQQVMAQYVELRPLRFWIAPNNIYGGSVIKLYGFQEKLLVVWGRYIRDARELEHFAYECAYVMASGERYNSHRSETLNRCDRNGLEIEVVEPNRGGHSEIAIIGPSGRRLPWGLITLSHRDDGGKVFVESTPRIRSQDWSWIEEIRDSLERVRSIKPSAKIRVIVDSLNIREKPSLNSKIVSKTKKNDEFVVLKREGPWVSVVPPQANRQDGVGWVHAKYVELVK